MGQKHRGVVGRNHYRYRYASGRQGEWLVTGFSPRKNDFAMYIMPGLNEHQNPMRRPGNHRTGMSGLFIRRRADFDEAVRTDLMACAVEAMSNRRVAG